MLRDGPELAGVQLLAQQNDGAWLVERGGRRLLALTVESELAPTLSSLRARVAQLAQADLHGFPKIRKLLEFGGQAFVLVDASEGRSFADLLSMGAVDSELAGRLARDLAFALARLHEAGGIYGPLYSTSVTISATGGAVFRDYGQAFQRRIAPTRSWSASEGRHAWTPADDFASLGALMSEWGLEAESSPVTELVSPHRPEPVRPLHGAVRRPELKRLRSTFLNLSGPSAVVLKGVPGVGKTHLAQAFCAELDNHRWVYATARRWDSTPFGVVAQLVEGFLHPGEGVESERLRFLVELPGVASQVLRFLSPGLADLIPTRGVQSTSDLTDDVFLESLVEVVELLLRELQGVVVVEDAQWIDERSRRLLRRVVSRAAFPVLFVVTARSDEDEAFQALRLLGDLQKILAWEVELEPLDSHGSSDLVEQYLGALPIPPQQAYALGMLGDGTPLGVLEVVRAVLQAGVLTPDWDRWHLDVNQVADLRLPNKATELIARRLRGLSSDSLTVLRVAAALGSSFEVPLLQRVSACTESQLTGVLAEAQRHCLLESSGGESEYHFVHQTIVDALSSGWNAVELKKLHASALVAMRSLLGETPEAWESTQLFRAAEHAALAEDLVAGHFARAVLMFAGRRAFDSFDNARALRFFGAAERLGALTGAEASRLCEWIGESHLRRGDLIASAERFERSLSLAATPRLRARILARLAWVFEAQFDSNRAWSYLSQAFAELGEQLPKLGVANAPQVFRLLMAGRVLPSRLPLEADERENVELTCTLLFQTCRLGAVRSDSSAVLASVARASLLASRLGPSAELSRVNAMVSFVQTLLGRHRAAAAAGEVALTMASKLNDPVVQANSMVVGSAVAIWRGEFDWAMQLLIECMGRYGSWLSPQDLGLAASNMAVVESIRGRVRVAKPWLLRAAERALEYDGVASVVSETLYLFCRAAIVSLGEESSLAWWLEKLRAACRPVPKESAYYLWTVGCRFRILTEAGGFPQEAEELVTWVESLGLDPKRVHLSMSEYYVSLAHALVNRCLDQAPGQRDLSRLKRAAEDLSKVARVPALTAHSLAIEGYLAYFRGKPRRAKRWLDAAERIAGEQKAPWVLYAVQRGHAYLARDAGRLDAANMHARAALQLADDNGAVHRARWVAEAFSLYERTPAVLPAAVHGSADESQLDAPESLAERAQRSLFNIYRVMASRLDAEQQAQAVLDELIATFDSERGALFMSAGGTRVALPVAARDLRLLATRSASGVSIGDVPSVSGALLDQVLSERAPACTRVDIDAGTAIQLVVAPLVVRGAAVGVVCLESRSGRVSFDSQCGHLVSALASPLSNALELTRVLRDRERLAEDLQQAQKMEAVGRLAGGIAHDFNNMLAAICVSVESAISTSVNDSESRADLETIRGAAERATRLTRQLLAFSRRQIVDARPLDLNDTIRDIVPMLRRLLGRDIDIEVELGGDVGPIKSDASQLEQVLVNLAVNARDAMPGGGRLELSTGEQDLENGFKADLEAGRYVVLSVKDDGVGMDRETQRRVFEPFFTTKDRESGTGLGLAMVYGIVRQNGGHIEFESAPGVGTEFRIYLPRTRDAVQTLPPPALRARASARTARILLVDDEPLVRHAFRRALSKLGYEVTVAASAREAIQYVAQNPVVDLVITDVIMPAMSGVAMIEKMQRMGVTAKVLYISGYADGVLTNQAALGDRVEFAQKPISSDTLSEVVSRMLESEEVGVPRGAS